MSIFRKVLTSALLLLAVGAQAQKTPKFPIERYTLDNGLRVVFSEDHSLPLVSVAVGYDVGSRSEVKGKTGFAHLFEHLMFQGSEHVKRGEYFKRLADVGGDLNGTTYEEVTNYQCVIPSPKLPLVLWMEADRMRSLAVNAENFKNQKDVVKEEKRMRLDNAPFREAMLKSREMAYSNYANSHLPIGLMEDLDNATLEYVQLFFKTYYVPNNAVLVVAGDFDPKQIKPLVQQCFGVIKRGPNPPKPDLTEPKRTKMEKVTIVDTTAPVSRMYISWPIPSMDSPELPAIILLNELLFSAQNSRTDDIGAGQHLTAFGGGVEDHRGPSVLSVVSQYIQTQDPDKLIDEMYVQIFRVQNELTSKEELNRVRTSYLLGEYRSEIEPLMERAVNMCHYTIWMDKPEQAYQLYEKVQAVTPEEIQAVAKKYMTRDTMHVVVVKMKEDEKK